MEHKRNSPRSCQFLLPLLHDYINHYFSSLFSLFFVLHFSLAMKIDLTGYLHTVAVEELVCVKTNIFKSNLIFKGQYQVLTIIIKTKKFRELFMRKRFHNYQLVFVAFWYRYLCQTTLPIENIFQKLSDLFWRYLKVIRLYK